MEKQIDSRVAVFGRNSLGGFGGERPPVNISFSVAAGRVEMKFPGELSELEIASILKESAAMLEAPTQEDVDFF